MAESMIQTQPETISTLDIFEIGIPQRTHIFDLKMSLLNISLTTPFILLRQDKDEWLRLEAEERFRRSDLFIEYGDLMGGIYGLSIVEPSCLETEKTRNIVIGDGPVVTLERVTLCVKNVFYYALKLTGSTILSGTKLAYIPYQEVTEAEIQTRRNSSPIPLWGSSKRID